MARSKTFRFSAGHRHARVDVDGGFTLMESLVAFTMFIIMASAATWWLIKTVQITGTTRDRVTASDLATAALERLRAENNAGQVLDSGTKSVVVHNVTYSVATSLSPASTTSCPTGSSRTVTVAVSWPDAAAPVRYDSVLVC